jgi:hypothetical protein
MAFEVVAFAGGFVLLIVFVLFIIGSIVPAIPLEGGYENTVTNVTNGFNYALNILTKPIFIVALAIVVILLAAIAITVLRSLSGGRGR